MNKKLNILENPVIEDTFRAFVILFIPTIFILFLTHLEIVQSPISRLFSFEEGRSEIRFFNLFIFFSFLAHFYLINLFSNNYKKSHNLIIVGITATLAAILINIAFRIGISPGPITVLTIITSFGFSSLIFSIYLYYSGGNRRRILNLYTYALPLLFLLIMPFILLKITALLNPATYDINGMMIDDALGFQPSIFFSVITSHYKLIEGIVNAAYYYLPFLFPIFFGLWYKNPQSLKVNLFSLIASSILIAVSLYLFIPVSGPKFLLGDLFPLNVDTKTFIEQYKDGYNVIPPSPRNGVPSMHFSWALTLWLASTYFNNKALRNFFAVYLGLTFIATLATGQHYLVDIVIAIPYTVSLFALFLRDRKNPVRWKVFLVNSGITFSLILIFKYAANYYANYPLTLISVQIVAVIVPIISYKIMLNSTFNNVEKIVNIPGDSINYWSAVINKTQIIYHALKGDKALVFYLFVFSGLSALIYEVVFSKSLSLLFGSTAIANSTVLAAFMTGMAIGSWIGGLLAERIKRPLLSYAYCELFIGVYCLLTPIIFYLIQNIYISLAANISPDTDYLKGIRLVLGITALLFPTVMMGITLPLLVRHFSNSKISIGVSVASLYGANTLGAAFGALFSGYFFIPLLGVSATIMLAAVINLSISFIVFRLRKSRPHLLYSFESQSTSYIKDHTGQSLVIASNDRANAYLALIVLTVGGFITLVLETNYIHLLSVVAGNSTYAFSLMLSTFLIGLSGGSYFASFALKRTKNIVALLVWLECILAVFLLITVFSWNDMPKRFSAYSVYPIGEYFQISINTLNFAQREFIRAIICGSILIPPAFIIGTIYPIALELTNRGFINKKMMMLGSGLALNTVGNITGVIVGGFFLLPKFGGLGVIHILAVLAILLAIICCFFIKKRKQLFFSLAPIFFSIFLFRFQPSIFNYTELASGANVYFSPQNFGQVIDHVESLDGGLTTVNMISGTNKTPSQKVLLTNGKFQGNDSGEMAAQIGFALAPLLHQSNRESALIIGYGVGVSSRTMYDAGFKTMDIVELSSDILTMANKHFYKINQLVTSEPEVQTHITDGRNYLLLQDKSYDVISMEISSIWFVGAATLYNKEFYQLAKRRLNRNGVLQQWIQFHHMRGEDFLTILATVRSEFRYVWLYEIGSQGIIVASDSPYSEPSAENIDKLRRTPTLQPLLKIVGDPGKLKEDVLLLPGEVDRYVNSVKVPFRQLISNDDNLKLEYGTPKGNAIFWDSSKQLIGQLRTFRGTPNMDGGGVK